MSGLVTFLHARLADDERVARAATAGPWRVVNGDHGAATVDGPDMLQDGGYDETTKSRRQVMRPMPVIPPDVDYGAVVDLGDAEHIVRWDPTRALAEVEAKRRIVDEHEPVILRGGSGARYYETTRVCRSCEPPKQFPETAVPCRTLRLLALPYADHSEYDESWRP